MDFIQTVHRQLAARGAIRAVIVRRQRLLGQGASALGLADGLAAGGPRLGDLPEEGPEDQAQRPKAFTGKVPGFLLNEAKALNPGAKERFQLVETGSGDGAEATKLAGEAPGPEREVRRAHLLGQCIYCPCAVC